MNTYHFTVKVFDVCSDLDNLEDKFFEVGCHDALLGISNHTAYLEFDREAANQEQAIKSALNDIRLLGFNDLTVEE